MTEDTSHERLPQNPAAAPRSSSVDDSTFVFPEPLSVPTITIEFCDRCRWLHRASWTQTELLLTFPPPVLGSVTLVPRNSEETAGRFRVWLSVASQPPRLLWDRKLEGGFPELKVLKQRVRDHIQPGLSLGHSDKKD
ncbi:putative rdx family protein [Lyophyllum shimeji]|uniref:Rdx family protein n=1 Tax=Lyophyllum shimeji TaxID=47721 RepID=A0A9P3PD39_LYOSH|nr:putative rdx family protein [Lyophyllum shimeji]